MTTFRGSLTMVLLVSGISMSSLAVTSAAQAAQTPQGTDKRVAVVNGETITEKQVQTEAASELDRLEAKRLQFEAGLTREKHTVVENQLNQMIEDRVLTAEAKKRGTTTDKLV